MHQPNGARVVEEHARSVTPLAKQPTRIRPKDFSTVSHIMDLALTDDPFIRYMADVKHNHRKSRVAKLIQDFARYRGMRKHFRLHTGWVLGEGEAFITYSNPNEAVPSTRFSRWLDRLATKLRSLSVSKEQIKRMKEINKKMQAARKAAGIDGRTMMMIGTVATLPAKQGRGYGTLLCNLVTEDADRRSLRLYLFSSNMKANSTFYQNLGFRSVHRFTVGEDNPAWNDPPVEVEFMIRDPVALDPVQITEG